MDEWAYVSQSWYGPLWWNGQWNDPAWLTYAAVDLPPVPKYAIAASLLLEGRRLPTERSTAAWYADTSSQFGDMATLRAARRPTPLFGLIGVLGTFAIATQIAGARAGALAALFLIGNPLYSLHAARAMSDVPTEAFLLCALALGLWAWRCLLFGRSPALGALTMILGAGLCAGISVACKLSGALAILVLAGWSIYGLVLREISSWRKATLVASTLGAFLISFSTFLFLNPVLVSKPDTSMPIPTAYPGIQESGLVGRALIVADHRMGASRQGQKLFPHDALETIPEKLHVMLVQGFGRFGPLGPLRSDSTRRFDVRQDWGAWIWLPVVLVGLIASAYLGYRAHRNKEAPLAWAFLVQTVVTLAVVTLFLPLAWDRYMMSLQPVAAILASLAIVTIVNLIWPGPSSNSPERMSESSAEPTSERGPACPV